VAYSAGPRSTSRSSFSPRVHLEEAEAVAEAVREELAPRHLLGCAAAGVVAGVRELELGPG